jgi:hypothetical protein
LANYWTSPFPLFRRLHKIYNYLSITYNRTTEETAKRLASFALDRLATQAALHAHDPDAFPKSFISMGHLRDDVTQFEQYSKIDQIKKWEDELNSLLEVLEILAMLYTPPMAVKGLTLTD